MPIKKSLRIILILFSIIPATIICILTYFYVEKTLITSREGDLNYLVTYSSSQISLVLNTQIYELNNQSTNWLFESSLLKNKTSNSTDSDNNLESIQSSLSTIASKYPYIRSLCLYDADGHVIATTKIGFSTKSDETLLLPDKQKTDQLSITFSASTIGSSYLIHITRPLFSSHATIIGYLQSSVKISYFDYLFDYSLGNTGEILLLDKDGTILYAKNHSFINTLIQNNSILSHLDTKHAAPTKSFVERYANKRRLSVISSIKGTDFFILINQNTSEITRGASIILYTLFACFFVMFILIIFASNLYSRYYTAPIFRLRDTIKKVSNGELNVRCEIDCKNEIGDLSKNFNKMIQIIQSSYDDLSSLHEQLLNNEEEIRSNYNHIEYLAYHDLITSLPNKLSFLEQIEMIFSKEENTSLMHAIYFIDLDNFKTINDTLGHDIGDEILNLTGKKLTSWIHDHDIVARLGGDEFLIFKYNISSFEEAQKFAQLLIESFSLPFMMHEETIHISLSIGISVYPFHGATHKTLIKNADIAMYQSKYNGKNRVSVFDKSMSDELKRKNEILDVLRSAIVNEEVYLMYQPQVDINTKKIIGYEALMRINSKKLGQLSPNEFIPIAEESGLIIDLGTWALKEACQFNKSLLDANITPYTVSVNISSLQLKKPGFVETIQTILIDTNLPSKYLALEITESTLIASLIDTVSVLKDFEKIGVQIALDDFGTGYSSLKYLTTLPITALKIDKSFIDNICLYSKDNYIATSIISLAHNIDIKVVAEGVETNEQCELLHSENCDIIQGFLFSRPLLPETLLSFLREDIIMNPMN
ncbi:MAG: EAL domain-containing protein [Velocimicrobium sp.]